MPYFIVRPRNLPLNGQNPTLLYGYGGFGKLVDLLQSMVLLWTEQKFH